MELEEDDFYETGGASRRGWVLPALLVLGAIIVAAAISVGSGDDDEPSDATSPPDPTGDVAAIESTASVDPADLAELYALSDLVIVGEVQSIERGRVFASPDASVDGDADDAASGVESALVTVQVDQVLRGEDPGATLLVEEEGWLADGRRISLDGAPPTEVGDVGLWFLIDTGDPDVPAWVTVGRFGRWTVRDGALSGPLLDEPIAIDLQDRPLDDVIADLSAIGPSPITTTSAP